MTDDPLSRYARRPPAQITAEDGAWAVTLPGLPFAAEGFTLAGAISELIQSLREYADDWDDRLRHAPHHGCNRALVQFVEASTDDQLANWLMGGHPTTQDERA